MFELNLHVMRSYLVKQFSINPHAMGVTSTFFDFKKNIRHFAQKNREPSRKIYNMHKR